MIGKLNENLKELVEQLRKQWGVDEMILTEWEEEQFRLAAKILEQNEKDCENFRGRDGI